MINGWPDQNTKTRGETLLVSCLVCVMYGHWGTPGHLGWSLSHNLLFMVLMRLIMKHQAGSWPYFRIICVTNNFLILWLIRDLTIAGSGLKSASLISQLSYPPARPPPPVPPPPASYSPSSPPSPPPPPSRTNASGFKPTPPVKSAQSDVRLSSILLTRSARFSSIQLLLVLASTFSKIGLFWQSCNYDHHSY